MNYNNEMIVSNSNNRTGLEYIKVVGLFGRLDISIPFDKKVNIYIGENGLGKTTILNCIYFILNKDMASLRDIEFSEIHVKFRDEKSVHQIDMTDILSYLNKYEYENKLDHTINFIINESSLVFSRELSNSDDSIEYLIRRLSDELDIPFYRARREVLSYINRNENLVARSAKSTKRGDPAKIDKLFASITKNIKEKILYLPTYRRIEDDFSKLNIDGEKFKKRDVLIKFGMADVQNLIDNTLDEIRKEAMDGFTKMTGVLLKQYSKNEDVDQKQMCSGDIDGEALKITLNRIGDKIDNGDKSKIITLHASKKIYEAKYSYLHDLLLKLIDNYQLQKKYDDKIKNFAYTCNKYLNEKKIDYNESELSLKIRLNSDSNESHDIKLKKLSSGEKQIISLFSKLYLDDEKDNIVIIDEPELSLSIKWQSMLLPDIMRSMKCSLLVTVTHSPFIFNNEFDMDAKEISQLIKNKI